MASRIFVDQTGRRWQVWEVFPTATAGRGVATVPERLRRGWLAFEGDGLKRRLAPIPDDWAALDDAGLRDLLARATVVTPRAAELPSRS